MVILIVVQVVGCWIKKSSLDLLTLRRLVFPPCVKFRFDYNVPFRTIMSVWGQLIAKTTKRSFCAWSTKRPRPQRTNYKGFQAIKWPCKYWLHFMFCYFVSQWDMNEIYACMFLCIFKHNSFLSSDRIDFLLQIKEIKSSIVEYFDI